MHLETFPPTDSLKPFVKTFMIIDSEHGAKNHILPDTSIIMAFRLNGRITLRKERGIDNLPSAVVTGLRKSSRMITYSKKAAALLVVFQEGKASAFFHEPLQELFGLHVSVDCLVPRYKLEETEQKLLQASNNQQRIAVVERFLLSQLKKPQSDLLISRSIDKIKSSKGIIRIKDLITELPVSRDPFEKRFRRITGTSPKQFADIVRMRYVIDSYQQQKNLTETAYEAGYFDQAHFTKGFKMFTGQTPKDFFSTPDFW